MIIISINKKQWAARQTLPSPGMLGLLPLQKQHCHVEHQWQLSNQKLGGPIITSLKKLYLLYKSIFLLLLLCIAVTPKVIGKRC